MTNPLEKAYSAYAAHILNKKGQPFEVKDAINEAITAFLQAVDKEKVAKSMYNALPHYSSAKMRPLDWEELTDKSLWLAKAATAINELLKQVKGE